MVDTDDRQWGRHSRATGTERTARSPAGRMRLADRLPDGFTDADLDAATREAAMAAFAKSWRRESGQCPLSGGKADIAK